MNKQCTWAKFLHLFIHWHNLTRIREIVKTNYIYLQQKLESQLIDDWTGELIDQKSSPRHIFYSRKTPFVRLIFLMQKNTHQVPINSRTIVIFFLRPFNLTSGGSWRHSWQHQVAHTHIVAKNAIIEKRIFLCQKSVYLCIKQ